MRLTHYISFIALICLAASCSSTPKKDGIEKTRISIEPRSKVEPFTQKNLAEKLELLIERKIAFKDISITYEGLLDQFSDSFKKKFTGEGGDLFKDLLPQWRGASEALITKVNAGDIKVTDTQLKLDKEDTELNGYSGSIEFISNGETMTFGFALFEVNQVFYLNFLRDYGLKV